MAKLNTFQTFISVKQKIQITPHFLRIIFDCPEVAHYAKTTLGANNKLFLPKAGQAAIELPVFDWEQRVWRVEDEEKRPEIRTYTHRDIDLKQQTLTIDFALHEGESIASYWAEQAQLGDRIGVLMGIQPQQIIPQEARQILIITDATGLPVTEVLLQQLDAGCKVYVIAEVMTPADELVLESKASIETIWVHNAQLAQHSVLTDTLRQHEALARLASPRFAHITAEYTAVRQCRDLLRKQYGWQKQECYACAYWKIGKNENQHQQKRIES